MCSHSYVLLHRILMFVPAKSHILPCALCCHAPSHSFHDIMTFHLRILSINDWDSGLVDCGTNILCGCWLFWQNKNLILFFAGHLSFRILVTTPLISHPSPVSYHQIWSFCSQWMIWDFGHVDCATNILWRCWLFWQRGPSSSPLIFHVNTLFCPTSILLHWLALLYWYTTRYFCIPLIL